MASRLVERLDAAIAAAEDPLLRECLKAERAGALARHGMLDDARFALAGLRSQAQRRRNPRLAAWVSLVDGQIDHFVSITPKAMDKFRQAHDLACEAGDGDLQALALAWMATLNFNASRLPAMAAQLREALQLATQQNHAAKARLGLVLADAHRFAGDDSRSQLWYQFAREHAIAEGDTSMMSALLHNISAMRAGRIGLDDCFDRGDMEAAHRALLEAESTANYDWGAGASALKTMVPLQARAQLLVVLGRWDEAVALFDSHLGRAKTEGLAHREARFVAERAWCHLRRDRPREALKDAKQAAKCIDAQFDPDDCAATHARLARVWRELSREDEALQHQALADQALAAYRAEQQRWRDALAQALEGLG